MSTENATAVAVAAEKDPDVNGSLRGQRKINGKLCQVDWMLIEALRKVSATLKTSAPTADLTDLDNLIEAADRRSEEVAHEDPPGCQPTGRTG